MSVYRPVHSAGFRTPPIYNENFQLFFFTFMAKDLFSKLTKGLSGRQCFGESLLPKRGNAMVPSDHLNHSEF